MQDVLHLCGKAVDADLPPTQLHQRLVVPGAQIKPQFAGRWQGAPIAPHAWHALVDPFGHPESAGIEVAVVQPLIEAVDDFRLAGEVVTADQNQDRAVFQRAQLELGLQQFLAQRFAFGLALLAVVLAVTHARRQTN